LAPPKGRRPLFGTGDLCKDFVTYNLTPDETVSKKITTARREELVKQADDLGMTEAQIDGCLKQFKIQVTTQTPTIAEIPETAPVAAPVTAPVPADKRPFFAFMNGTSSTIPPLMLKTPAVTLPPPPPQEGDVYRLEGVGTAWVISVTPNLYTAVFQSGPKAGTQSLYTPQEWQALSKTKAAFQPVTAEDKEPLPAVGDEFRLTDEGRSFTVRVTEVTPDLIRTAVLEGDKPAGETVVYRLEEWKQVSKILLPKVEPETMADVTCLPEGQVPPQEEMVAALEEAPALGPSLPESGVLPPPPAAPIVDQRGLAAYKAPTTGPVSPPPTATTAPASPPPASSPPPNMGLTLRTPPPAPLAGTSPLAQMLRGKDFQTTPAPTAATSSAAAASASPAPETPAPEDLNELQKEIVKGDIKRLIESSAFKTSNLTPEQKAEQIRSITEGYKLLSPGDQQEIRDFMKAYRATVRTTGQLPQGGTRKNTFRRRRGVITKRNDVRRTSYRKNRPNRSHSHARRRT
jgi:hypothetical protein